MIPDPLKIIFMGTPDFAKCALQALLQTPHQIIAVYTQPPKPAGRGHQIQESAVHQFAAEQGIPVFHPENFKDPKAVEEFQSLGADLAVVAAYGLILPLSILESPKLGCWNIHASLLPRWRGASPIQRAIQYGDPETGITIMQMDRGMDTGDILLQDACPINETMTSADLFEVLAQMGGKVLSRALELRAQGLLSATPQDAAHVTYAPKIAKEEGHILWSESPHDIVLRLRAFTPWPGCYFTWQGQTVKILKAQSRVISEPSDRTLGTILDDQCWVVCQGGDLLLESVLVPGKKAMSGRDFMNGYGLKTGTVLES